MNLVFLILALLIVISFLFDLFVQYLNLKNLRIDLPEEFKGYYDEEKYAHSQKYLREKARFSLIETSIMTSLLVLFVLLNGITFLDNIMQNIAVPEFIKGFFFFGILMIIMAFLDIPFDYYFTFVIEEKYGFNKMTKKMFVSDLFKSWIVSAVIGGGALIGLFAAFQYFGSLAWFFNWLIFVAFTLLFSFIAPVLLIPLFYKFTPLQEGELKESIENLAKKVDYKLEGIYTIDGSKRSTKANAFFTGFGKLKRIALFDTLIEHYSKEEITSILAHEIGHNKKKHVPFNISLSVLSMGMMFFIIDLIAIKSTWIFDLFLLETTSLYVGILLLGFVYAFTPVSTIMDWLTNELSRYFEYQADKYAIDNYNEPEAYITALKKLTVQNYSNLTPHWLTVKLEYTHPPVLKRIENIRKLVS